MRIELFCENCKNRWLCKEPCARWYDELEEELKQQKGELNMANFKLKQSNVLGIGGTTALNAVSGEVSL